MAKGKSVCIYGAKGGIGKTTFTINLAGIFHKLNKKVLIIDLDLFNGSVALLLNKDVSKTLFNFYEDIVNNKFENLSKYVTKYNENISFLACPKDPRKASKIDAKSIEALIEKSRFLYDVILIDTTNYLSEINIMAMDKCDELLFMTSNDIASLKNLRNVLNVISDTEIINYKIILNNSSILNKDYFSLYDIKNILGASINYKISEKFNYKNLDSLSFEGKIMSLCFSGYPDEKVLNLIAKDILKGEENE